MDTLVCCERGLRDHRQSYGYTELVFIVDHLDDVHKFRLTGAMMQSIFETTSTANTGRSSFSANKSDWRWWPFTIILSKDMTFQFSCLGVGSVLTLMSCYRPGTAIAHFRFHASCVPVRASGRNAPLI